MLQRLGQPDLLTGLLQDIQATTKEPLTKLSVCTTATPAVVRQNLPASSACWHIQLSSAKQAKDTLSYLVQTYGLQNCDCEIVENANCSVVFVWLIVASNLSGVSQPIPTSLVTEIQVATH